MLTIKGLSATDNEKLNRGELLPVMEEFYTLQGEGEHTGKAAWFIRIGGCDVGCRWCDVKESWNPNHFPPLPTAEVIDRALKSGAKTVVITGGEPLQYNLDVLCKALRDNRISTHIESSGSNRISGAWDWICLSPKRNKPPVDALYGLADELKVIIENEEDFAWAELNKKRVNASCALYLQPEWSRRKEIAPLIVDYVLAHPEWKISIQTHKYLHIP